MQRPFPEAWRAIMERNVGHVRFLQAAERERLESLVQVFLAEKNLEGCGGLELDDEVCVTVAASACILLLGLDHDMYRRVRSVLIYPTTVRPPERRPSIFANAQVQEPVSALVGEAHERGPVIVVWDDARRGARDPRSGHNVVFHEFAHKLDMLDGLADGTPPLRGSAQLARFAEVFSRAYEQLQRQVEAGEPSFMDDYGAKNEAEFFAVATETFFEKPFRLRREQPEVYDVLRDFYRQDPAERMRKAGIADLPA